VSFSSIFGSKINRFDVVFIVFVAKPVEVGIKVGGIWTIGWAKRRLTQWERGWGELFLLLLLL
jgi:hypothetical protein